MIKSLLLSCSSVVVLSALVLTTGCSPKKFEHPEEKNTVLATPIPEPELPDGQTQEPEGFEVSSGASIDGADASGEVLLSGTVGSPVETLQVAETNSDDNLSTGFWSLFNIF